MQEAIYGTKLLRRLEAIKAKVDREFMFDCHGCIGNNRKGKMVRHGDVLNGLGGDVVSANLRGDNIHNGQMNEVKHV